MLKCKECGGRSVEVISMWELRSISRQGSTSAARPWANGSAGPVPWEALLGVLKLVLRIVARETEPFAYCKACGYTEKLENDAERR